MSKVVVFHAGYGCETGCCGHVVEVDGKERFFFDHPYGESPLEFAQRLVRQEVGSEHVADLDWDNCLIIDD